MIAIVASEKIRDYIRLADKLEQSADELEKIIEQKLFEAGAIEKVRTKAQPRLITIKRNGGIRGHANSDSDDD